MKESGKGRAITLKAICFFCGLILISLGINISKMSGLGVSGVSSIPRACEVIWGLTLGKTTMLVYFVLVLLQLAVLRKRFKLRNVLGIPLSVLFGYIVDLTGTDPAAFGHLLLGFPAPGGYVTRLIYILIAMFCIGGGVFLYMLPGWIPMPAEGLAAAISEVTGKRFGDCKTGVDCALVLGALLLQLVFLGGLTSFRDHVIVREGTVLIAILVGQVVKYLNKHFREKIICLWMEGSERKA